MILTALLLHAASMLLVGSRYEANVKRGCGKRQPLRPYALRLCLNASAKCNSTLCPASRTRCARSLPVARRGFASKPPDSNHFTPFSLTSPARLRADIRAEPNAPTRPPSAGRKDNQEASKEGCAAEACSPKAARRATGNGRAPEAGEEPGHAIKNLRPGAASTDDEIAASSAVTGGGNRLKSYPASVRPTLDLARYRALVTSLPPKSMPLIPPRVQR